VRLLHCANHLAGAQKGRSSELFFTITR
jgi:hypothetical protein